MYRLARRLFHLALFSVGLFSVSLCVCTQYVAAQDPPVMDGMLLWLDATDTDSLFQEPTFALQSEFGDPVGLWFDKSGNNHHATQTGAARPEYVADVMNGQPAVRLNAGDGQGTVSYTHLTLPTICSV